MAAERDAVDRFTTLYMADKTGATFPARISGVARFGLFARLNETGADGIMAAQPTNPSDRTLMLKLIDRVRAYR